VHHLRCCQPLLLLLHELGEVSHLTLQVALLLGSPAEVGRMLLLQRCVHVLQLLMLLAQLLQLLGGLPQVLLQLCDACLRIGGRLLQCTALCCCCVIVSLQGKGEKEPIVTRN
jgi:hypothetical protein